jgi:hypothetical protein
MAGGATDGGFWLATGDGAGVENPFSGERPDCDFGTGELPGPAPPGPWSNDFKIKTAITRTPTADNKITATTLGLIEVQLRFNKRNRYGIFHNESNAQQISTPEFAFTGD